MPDVMQRIYVEWEDCFSIDRWLPSDQAIEQTKDNLQCFSIGFVITDDENGVTMCHSWQSEGQVCGILKIPFNMIKKKEYI